MYCLNCGHQVHSNQHNCPNCNIDIAKNGTFYKGAVSTDNNHASCGNCGTKIAENEANCPSCNFPVRQKKFVPGKGIIQDSANNSDNFSGSSSRSGEQITNSHTRFQNIGYQAENKPGVHDTNNFFSFGKLYIS